MKEVNNSKLHPVFTEWEQFNESVFYRGVILYYVMFPTVLAFISVDITLEKFDQRFFLLIFFHFKEFRSLKCPLLHRGGKIEKRIHYFV